MPNAYRMSADEPTIPQCLTQKMSKWNKQYFDELKLAMYEYICTRKVWKNDDDDGRDGG